MTKSSVRKLTRTRRIVASSGIAAALLAVAPVAISAAEDSPSGSSSESDSSSDSAGSKQDSTSKTDDDGDSAKKDEGGDSPAKDDAGDNDADNDAGSPLGEAEPDGEKAETEPADKSETPAENTTAPKVAETTPDVTQTEVTTPARRTPSILPRPHKTYMVPGLSTPDHDRDPGGASRKPRKIADPVDVAAPVIPAAPLVTPVLADRDDVKSETAYITALPVKVKEGKDGILSAFTSATGKGGLILLNQSAVVLGVLNRRSRGDGSDYLGILGPGERMTLPTQVVATGSLGKHTWDDEADGVELDEPVVRSFLEKSVVEYSVDATVVSARVGELNGVSEDAVVTYAALADLAGPSQYPGYVDLPLLGEPDYESDPRGTEVDTDDVIPSNEDGVFAFGYDLEDWEAAAAGDPDNSYFTLDDMPRWHFEGSTSVNSEWISALDAVAFVGFKDPDLTRESGYADGFYDPDYNNPGGSVYYTNTTADTVLVTIYEPMQGNGTLEAIELDPGQTLEIEKARFLTYKMVTVQAPRSADGRVNVITTQAIGYPELTQDIRTVDLPGNPPSGNPAYDELVVLYATSHVDNYSFYPGTDTPENWDYVSTPPVDPGDPEVPPGVEEPTVSALAKALSGIMTSKAYGYLGDAVSIVGTLVGHRGFNAVTAAAGIGTAVSHLTNGDSEKAAIEFLSVLTGAAKDLIKFPARANAVAALGVLAVQVVAYTAQLALDTDWSDSGAVLEYAVSHPDETLEEINKAAEIVAVDLSAKIVGAILGGWK